MKMYVQFLGEDESVEYETIDGRRADMTAFIRTWSRQGFMELRDRTNGAITFVNWTSVLAVLVNDQSREDA